MRPVTSRDCSGFCCRYSKMFIPSTSRAWLLPVRTAVTNSPQGDQLDRLVSPKAIPRSDPGASLRKVSNSGVQWNRSSESMVSSPSVKPARISRKVVSGALRSRCAISAAVSGPVAR